MNAASLRAALAALAKLETEQAAEQFAQTCDQSTFAVVMSPAMVKGKEIGFETHEQKVKAHNELFAAVKAATSLTTVSRAICAAR
jgi:hypothetical protein